MSIRLQLLIVALTTLILPWAGCQYARELEGALRFSQENALEASADTIAHALSADPQRVFRNVADAAEPFDAAQGDLYVFPLRNQPLLDGYHEDWNVPAEPELKSSAGGFETRLQAGYTERFLFLYLEVDNPRFIAEPADVHPEHDRFDRVDITVQKPDGSVTAYFFATSAPGLIEAQAVVKGDDGVDHAASEPRIQAFWLQTSRGYHLEARLPMSLVGSRLWIQARDRADGLGVAGAGSAEGGRLFMATPGLAELLATFISPGTHVMVVDTNALILGAAGVVKQASSDDYTEPDAPWYRSLVTEDTSAWPVHVSAPDRARGTSVTEALKGHRAAEWQRTAGGPPSARGNHELLLSAAAPITVGEATRGAVVLEQSGDQLEELRDAALTHLFNLTLLATALAVVFAVSVATLISVRIGRLRLAADSAVGNDGRIRLAMPESGRADEIGALSRAFERLLYRLNEHTQYLRTLGGKLAHELRTPLSIVRSSLDNLESEGLRAEQRVYVTRAREGAMRLQSILSALGAAARVEESIKQAERVNFDLRELVSSAVGGYRDAFLYTRIEFEVPPDTCFLRGAPDLIVQMLDKLVENAVDFCTAAGAITVRLTRAGGNYELAVSNDGPPIPPPVLERLFESLFEQRAGRDDRPHFGLGLYIVRLIAEFHEGRATAANRPDDAGAVFTVVLPLI